jgi:hypothetical protein
MTFEFQNDYDNIANCPPKDYKAQEIENVFRWFFDDIEDNRNFQTQYHKNPKRFQVKSDLEVCKALALSMFDNLEGARERFDELSEDLGDKVYQILGTQIAQGKITAVCGVNGKIERLGHFNHHAASGVPAQKSFVIIESLK